MKAKRLVSSYTKAKFKPGGSKVNEADLLNVLNREFDGHAPHTHIVSDLTYVRVGRRWNYICLLPDLYNREIVGHACGERKDANLVKASFATIAFPLFEIDVFHTDPGEDAYLIGAPQDGTLDHQFLPQAVKTKTERIVFSDIEAVSIALYSSKNQDPRFLSFVKSLGTPLA